jgi:hypothetical protein
VNKVRFLFPIIESKENQIMFYFKNHLPNERIVFYLMDPDEKDMNRVNVLNPNEEHTMSSNEQNQREMTLTLLHNELKQPIKFKDQKEFKLFTVCVLADKTKLEDGKWIATLDATKSRAQDRADCGRSLIPRSSHERSYTENDEYIDGFASMTTEDCVDVATNIPISEERGQASKNETLLSSNVFQSDVTTDGSLGIDDDDLTTDGPSDLTDDITTDGPSDTNTKMSDNFKADDRELLNESMAAYIKEGKKVEAVACRDVNLPSFDYSNIVRLKFDFGFSKCLPKLSDKKINFDMVLYETEKCIICFSDNPINKYILLCGHASYCDSCILKMDEYKIKNCPECRNEIFAYHNIRNN